MAGKNATSEDKIPQVEPSNANAFQRSTLSALKGDGKHQYAAFGRFQLRKVRPALGIAALLTVRCCNLERHHQRFTPSIRPDRR